MGMIPSVDNMPSLKITFPTNGQILQSDVAFSMNINVTNLETGNIVSSRTNFLAAPQQLAPSGNILGHVNLVIEDLGSLSEDAPLNPLNFAFAKSLTDKDNNGLLTAAIPNSLPAGFYRAFAIILTANFQPVLMPVVQRGSLHDAVYVSLLPNVASFFVSLTSFTSYSLSSRFRLMGRRYLMMEVLRILLRLLARLS